MTIIGHLCKTKNWKITVAVLIDSNTYNFILYSDTRYNQSANFADLHNFLAFKKSSLAVPYSVSTVS